jgi:tetratricopeptide (TPR) repeat protein
VADQNLRLDIGEFRLDLHGTSIATSEQVMRRRIEECYRYGLRTLKIVYGTPDEYEHSIAKAAHVVVRSHDLVAQEMLPSYVFRDKAPEKLEGALIVYLRENFNALPISSDTTFQPFMPKYEEDLARLLRCRTPYTPLRRSYPFVWAADAIGHQCTPTHLDEIVKQKRVAPELIPPHSLTWDGVCLAARAYAELRKAQKGKQRNLAKGSALAESRPPKLSESVQPSPPDTVTELARARLLTHESRYEEAVALLQQLEASGPGREILLDILYELGRAYMALRKDKAETALLRALDLADVLADSGRRLLAILQQMWKYYIVSGDMDALNRLIDKYQSLDTGENGTEAYMHGFMDLALIDYKSGQYASSLISLRRFSYVKGNGSISAALNGARFNLLGRNYTALGDFLSATIAFECALKHFRSNMRDCRMQLPAVLLSQGILQRQMGLNNQALTSYEEARKILAEQQAGDSLLYADVASSIGVIFRHQRKLSNAESSLEEARQIYIDQGVVFTPDYATILSNLARLRADQLRYDEARELLDQARQIMLLKNSANSDGLVRLLLSESGVHLAAGEHDLAQVALEEARGLAARSVGIRSLSYAKATDELARVYILQGEQSKAHPLLEESAQIFNAVGHLDLSELLEKQIALEDSQA